MATQAATTPQVAVRVKIRPPTFEELFEASRLRKTSITIRKEVRLLRARDAVDWIDWFVSLDGSLSALSHDIISGSYTPSAPTRYELAKSHGAFRVITAFHAFRHGNETVMDGEGVPMATRQNRLGHSDARTTMKYTHVVSEDGRKIAARFGELLTETETVFPTVPAGNA